MLYCLYFICLHPLSLWCGFRSLTYSLSHQELKKKEQELSEKQEEIAELKKAHETEVSLLREQVSQLTKNSTSASMNVNLGGAVQVVTERVKTLRYDQMVHNKLTLGLIAVLFIMAFTFPVRTFLVALFISFAAILAVPAAFGAT